MTTENELLTAAEHLNAALTEAAEAFEDVLRNPSRSVHRYARALEQAKCAVRVLQIDLDDAIIRHPETGR